MQRLVGKKNGMSGFSSMEIVIVCGVIVLLSSILLPLARVAKDTARRGQCASNLRQFAAAFCLYSNDWSGCWPSPSSHEKSYWAHVGSGGVRQYMPVGATESVWCCPMVSRRHGFRSPCSYAMNKYLSTPPDIDSSKQGIDPSRLLRAGKTVLLYEGVEVVDNYNACLTATVSASGNWQYVRGYNGTTSEHPFHGKYNNYLYCDGHVLARRPGSRLNNNLSSHSEMYEWYVDKAAYEVNFGESRSRRVSKN